MLLLPSLPVGAGVSSPAVSVGNPDGKRNDGLVAPAVPVGALGMVPVARLTLAELPGKLAMAVVSKPPGARDSEGRLLDAH